MAAEREHPHLGALPEHREGAAVEVHVVHRETHGLRDPRPGAVEELQQCAIPQGDGSAVLRDRREERCHLGVVERVRQRPGGRGGRDTGRDVVGHPALRQCEAVEATDCRDETPGGRRREGTAAVVAGPHGTEAGRHVLGGDGGEVRVTAGREEGLVACQVPRVGLQRVAGQPTLHAEVGEVLRDERVDGGHPRRRTTNGSSATATNRTVR